MKHAFLSQIAEIAPRHPAVKLAYFFGSRARGEEGPMSDYDFAFYADLRDAKEQMDLRLSLLAEITRLLGSDQVDVVLLTSALPPELAYSIIKEGILFYEQEPFRVIVEPQILNRYFDFVQTLRPYGLTAG